MTPCESYGCQVDLLILNFGMTRDEAVYALSCCSLRNPIIRRLAAEMSVSGMAQKNIDADLAEAYHIGISSVHKILHVRKKKG